MMRSNASLRAVVAVIESIASCGKIGQHAGMVCERWTHAMWNESP